MVAVASDPPIEASAPRRLNPRLGALAETVVLLAALLAGDRLLGAGDRFATLQPHPFWAVVLLIAAQYGTREAIVAAVLATLARYAGVWPRQTLGQSLESWFLHAWLTPSLWLVAALAIGELQARHRRARDRLAQALAQSRERELVIARAYDDLAKLKNSLEATVAGQLRTVFSIYKAARAVEKLAMGEVLVGVSELVRSVLNPTKFSLFLLNGQCLEAAVCEGWRPDDPYQTRFDPSAVLFQSIVARRQMLAAPRPSEGFILGAEGVLAGPLASVDTGELVGMLKIEQVPFAELTPATIQNFAILCEWIGTAFANARRFEESKDAAFLDPLRNLLSASFFDQQKVIVQKIAQRMKFDATMVFVRVDDTGAVTQDDQVALARLVAAAAATALRTTDLRFDYRKAGWDYAVILIGTGSDGAVIAADKLVQAIRRQLEAANMPGSVHHAIESLHQCG